MRTVPPLGGLVTTADERRRGRTRAGEGARTSASMVPLLSRAKESLRAIRPPGDARGGKSIVPRVRMRAGVRHFSVSHALRSPSQVIPPPAYAVSNEGRSSPLLVLGSGLRSAKPGVVRATPSRQGRRRTPRSHAEEGAIGSSATAGNNKWYIEDYSHF